MQYQRFLKTQGSDPVLCYCGRDENLEPGARYGPVIRDVYIIECCTGGYGSVIINGTEFKITPGDCYILLPGDTVVHTADNYCPRSGVWCAVSGLQIGRALARAGIDSSHPFAPRTLTYKIADIIEQLLLIKQKQDMGADMYRTACIYKMLALLLDGFAHTDSDSIIQKAVGFIETQYYNRLNVCDIAAFVGLERSYFSTLFKARTGLCPHEYINKFRIAKACTMLKQGSVSVGEVAQAVGMDAHNFSRIFKKEMSVTPLVYKNRV